MLFCNCVACCMLFFVYPFFHECIADSFILECEVEYPLVISPFLVPCVLIVYFVIHGAHVLLALCCLF